MGAEARVEVTLEKADGSVETGAAKALLETDFLRVSGEVRMTIRFAEMRSVEAQGDALVIQSAAGDRLRLALGAKAAAGWADKIRNPPSLLDKLGIRDGLSVATLHVDDRAFLGDLRGRVPDAIAIGAPGDCPPATDVLVAMVASLEEIAALAPAVPRLAPTGALWIVFPKGRQGIKDSAVIPEGKRLGLVDNKVARFSETHTALRFVVPKEARKSWKIPGR